MRIKSKREGFFAIVLIICLLVTGKTVIANDNSPQEDYVYYSIGDNIAIMRYNGTDANVIIPETIEGKPVTEIQDGTFNNNSYVKSIVIPKSITYIGAFAFAFCPLLSSFDVDLENAKFMSKDGVLHNKTQTTLIRYPEGKTDTKVVLPQSIKSINDNAFLNCDYIVTINIPESVTKIGNRAFDDSRNITSIELSSQLEIIGDMAFTYCTSLTDIIIPKTVTSIGIAAFQGCWNLPNITISANLKVIGENAFSGCTKMSAINVDAKNTHFKSENGILFNYTKTKLIRYPDGKTNSVYNIPESVKTIGEWAFSGNAHLNTISVPESIETIGHFAFFGCQKLTDINIPDSITVIDEGTFGNCTSLDKIELSNNTTTLKTNAFSNCNFEIFEIPTSVAIIEENAFGYCYRLVGFEVNEDHPYLDVKDGVLFNKNLTEIIVYPRGKIEKTYTIPPSVTKIRKSAFNYNTNLVAVTIPSSVVTIDERAFQGCENITSIKIPEGVTTLSGVFAYCKQLSSIILPNSITAIDEYNFMHCNNLVIKGFPNSYANTYAIKNGIDFEPMKLIAKMVPTSLLLDGKQVNLSAYNINGYTYFKLRDIAQLLTGSKKQFDVYWDTLDRSINIVTACMYTPVGGELAMLEDTYHFEPKSSVSSIYLDGVKTQFTTFNIEGSTYFKLRDIASSIDFGLIWNANTSSIEIDTANSYVE